MNTTTETSTAPGKVSDGAEKLRPSAQGKKSSRPAGTQKDGPASPAKKGKSEAAQKGKASIAITLPHWKAQAKGKPSASRTAEDPRSSLSIAALALEAGKAAADTSPHKRPVSKKAQPKPSKALESERMDDASGAAGMTSMDDEEPDQTYKELQKVRGFGKMWP